SEAVAALPAAQRSAIEMAYLCEHSYRQAADLLGRPEGTVKGQIRSGLVRLRGVMASWAPEPLAGAGARGRGPLAGTTPGGPLAAGAE
ncbi:MAG: RNA polymerase sigma factor, partial [Acidimicrobiales bacterium]